MQRVPNVTGRSARFAPSRLGVKLPAFVFRVREKTKPGEFCAPRNATSTRFSGVWRKRERQNERVLSPKMGPPAEATNQNCRPQNNLRRGPRNALRQNPKNPERQKHLFQIVARSGDKTNQGQWSHLAPRAAYQLPAPSPFLPQNRPKLMPEPPYSRYILIGEC